MADLEIDCHNGCHWCCHQLVVITCKEDAKVILKTAKEKMTDQEFTTFTHTVRGQAKAISALPYEQAEQKKWTCPLLKNGSCTVYEVRPVACRSVFSPDHRCCQQMLEAESLADMPPDSQQLAMAIHHKAEQLQVMVNDLRPIDGAFEMRVLLAQLIEE